MKKTLQVIGLIIVAIIVVSYIASEYQSKRPCTIDIVLSGGKCDERAREEAAKQAAEINTSLSYIFDDNGAVVTQPASPRIELKINGSDQPLRGKAPLSFTLSWKIDPAIELDDCKIEGPSVRAGYYSEVWGFDVFRWKTSTSYFIDAHVADFIKAHGGYEGSLEFKNVVPAQYGPDDDRNDLEKLSKTPLYYGVASFYPGPSVIEINCGWGSSSENGAIGIWIDQ
ncbi:MAG: hypothetical protein AAB659_00085 [Patescibacteria group bacterium]|mgnify:CR=1 FL=1